MSDTPPPPTPLLDGILRVAHMIRLEAEGDLEAIVQLGAIRNMLVVADRGQLAEAWTMMAHKIRPLRDLNPGPRA